MEWIISFIGNTIILFIICSYYWVTEKGVDKRNKYSDKEELEDAVLDLTNKFLTLIPLIVFINWVNNVYYFKNLEILYRWILFLGILIVFCLMNGVIDYLEKKKGFSLVKDSPEILKTLIKTYELDQEWNRYFLSERGSTLLTVGKWLGVIYLAWFEVIYDFSKMIEYSVSAAIYPVFLLFIFIKIYLIVSGYTKEEYCVDVLKSDCKDTENPRITIVSDNVIRQLSRYKLWEENDISKKRDERLKSREKNDDYESKLLEHFMENRDKEEYKVDYLINPTANLLKKQNVIFNTFFYRDLELAVFFPMMLAAFKGKKSIIVMEEPDYDKEKRWIQGCIEKMSGIYDFVSVKEFNQADQNDDIFVMGYKEFLDWQNSSLLKCVADRLELLFLVEPSVLNLQELSEIGNLRVYVENQGSNLNIAIADSHQEIAERMMIISDAETVYKGPYYLIPKQYSVVLWDADCRENKDFESNEIETKIIHVLIEKATCGEIVWINQNVRPSVDLWWYYQRYAGQLDKAELKHVENGRELEAGKESYYIIEDSEYNYLRIKERFLSRAEEKCFICIVSPNYLLRNYMLQSHNIKASLKRKLQDVMIGEKPITERNIIIKLIQELYCRYIHEEEIWSDILGIREKQNAVYLKELIDTFFRELDVKVEEKTERVSKLYRICKNDKIDTFMMRNKDLSVYSDKKLIKVWSRMNYHTIFQKHLPGQNLVISGGRYQFLNIDSQEKNYSIKVKRNPGNDGAREYYRQIRSYVLTKEQSNYVYLEKEKCVHSINIKLQFMNVLCCTKGYMKLPRFQDFGHGVYIDTRGIPDRNYQNKEVLRISILNADVLAQMYFAVILREILYTLCPEYVDYLGIGICTTNIKALEKYIDAGIVWKIDDSNNKEEYIYIIEDHVRELGIIHTIEKKMDFIVELMLSYIEWYLQNEDEYLSFGFEIDKEELKKSLITLQEYILGQRDSISDMMHHKETQSELLVETIQMEEKTKKFQDEEEAEGKKNLEKNEITEEEADAIFAEVLGDMLYYRDLNINIALKLYLDKKAGKKGKTKKNHNPLDIYLSRYVDRKTFYRNCAYEIIKAYNDYSQGGLNDTDCDNYAQDYVELTFL